MGDCPQSLGVCVAMVRRGGRGSRRGNSAAAPSKPPRIAHSGGVITSNKPEAMRRFILRLLRSGALPAAAGAVRPADPGLLPPECFSLPGAPRDPPPGLAPSGRRTSTAVGLQAQGRLCLGRHCLGRLCLGAASQSFRRFKPVANQHQAQWQTRPALTAHASAGRNEASSP